MRKPTFHICKISFAVTEKLISAFVFAVWHQIKIITFSFYNMFRDSSPLLCFCYIDSTISLLSNPNFSVSSHFLCLYSMVCVKPVWKPYCWISHDAAQISIVHLFEFLGMFTISDCISSWCY